MNVYWNRAVMTAAAALLAHNLPSSYQSVLLIGHTSTVRAVAFLQKHNQPDDRTVRLWLLNESE